MTPTSDPAARRMSDSSDIRCESFRERSRECIVFRCPAAPYCEPDDVTTLTWRRARPCRKYRCGAPSDDPEVRIVKNMLLYPPPEGPERAPDLQ